MRVGWPRLAQAVLIREQGPHECARLARNGARACGILGLMDQPDKPRAETQEERAVRSLQAIYGGADLTAESMKLANEFTDRQTGRLKNWVRGRSGGKQ
jgi:hypothetical protein